MKKKPIRCSLPLAMAIVECFQKDGLLEAISNDLWPEGLWRHSRARTWVPLVNRLAADALWDGFPNKATNLLTKHGISANERNTVFRDTGITYDANKYRASQMDRYIREVKALQSPVDRNVRRIK